VAALASASAAFSTAALSAALSVLVSHAARPSARTATVSATFFMIVPFLAYGERPSFRETAPARPHASVRPAAGNIDVSRVTQSSFVAEAEKFLKMPSCIDRYKDFLISLSGDPAPQACRAFSGAGRSNATAHPGAAKSHGTVGRRACPVARPEPATGFATCQDPQRLGPCRPAQGGKLGL